jgi:hypothetical protein
MSPGPSLPEDRRVDVLHPLLDQLDRFLAEQLPEAPGVGLDEAQSRGPLEEALVHVERERRRVAGADLDHPARAEHPQQPVIDERVDGGEQIVLEPVARARVGHCGREVAVEGGDLPHALEHRLRVELDAGQPARWQGAAPLEVGELARSRQRRVEVPRLDPQPGRARERSRACREPP